MTSRKVLLRANALYLLVAATGGVCADLAGAFFGYGPFTNVLSAARTSPSASSRRPCLT